ncbi:MAG: acyl-CoA dehydratase activase [Negativicutes bacterium]|nr:acyl-CoA dehydratase activase [Negativicutes bacterium]
MLTAGIDVGAKNVKIVVLKDGAIVGKGKALMETDREKSINDAFNDTLDKLQIKEADIDFILATGGGAKGVSFATSDSTLVTCISRGVRSLDPSIKTIIDVGANDSIAIKLDENGKVVDFAVNEKCAAGAGSFVEAMARAMEVSLDDFVKYSLMSTKSIPINAQCVIFAESEVVSLIHEETDRNDICRAVHDAMAGRIASMARRVRIVPPVAIVGGASFNMGLLDALKNELSIEFVTVENPDFVGALGASLMAVEMFGKSNK